MTKALHIAMRLFFLAALAMTSLLAGCAVKGQLQRPADAPKEAVADENGKKPHRGFVLDRLL